MSYFIFLLRSCPLRFPLLLPSQHRQLRRDVISQLSRQANVVSVEGELRSSQYERDVQIIGGGQASVTTKSWDIRTRAVRKLVKKKKAKKIAA